MSEQTRSATGGPSAAGEPLTVLAPNAAVELPSRYQWVEELARGGMGRVFVARDQVLRREVAVKEALSTASSSIRRFEREALLTARLQHPGIVSVYELARRASGEPYLIMRRVRGEPLSRALERTRKLSERLALLSAFVSVAETVAYAHQQGVIHRDLKPSNILLGEFGDTVVIDWGLAKELAANNAEEADELAEDSGADSAQLTRVGTVLGTPSYMSPEQARGEAVDRRADVYALGAILYELLSGTPPYKGDSGKATVDSVRGGPPVPLPEREPQLASELATIVSRAMARDVADRYPDARALAEDLRRFQTGRLVQSHVYSLRELVARWAKKHARTLALAAAFLVTLAAVGAEGVRRVVNEKDRANREAAAAARVSDFMTRMFRVVDPSEAKGNTVTAREILDRASKDIETGLTQDVELQARLMATMGEVYQQLGLFGRAEALLTRAADKRQALLGTEHPQTLKLQSAVATAVFLQGRYDDAAKKARAVLEQQRRVLGPKHPDTLATLDTLGTSLRESGHFAEAEPLHREAHEGMRVALGENHRATLVALGHVADDLHEQSKLREAEAVWKEVISRRRAALGDDDRDTAWAFNGASSTQKRLGNFQAAFELDQEALKIRQKVLGPDHPDTLQTLHALGNDYWNLQRFEECEATHRKVLEARRRVLGDEHPNTLNSMQNHANALRAIGQLKEAEAQLTAVLQIRRRVLGEDHVVTINNEHALAQTYQAQKRFKEADAMYRSVADRFTRAVGPQHFGVGGAYYDLACSAAQQGHRADVISNLKRSFEHGLDREIRIRFRTDAAFANMLGDPEFEALVQEQLAADARANGGNPKP